MSRKQLHKGYERRQHDKQHDRDRNAYRKAKRKGITGLMDEVTLLKEEIHMLQRQHDRDQLIINDQREVNTRLEKQAIKQRYRECVLIGALVSTWVAILYIMLGVL